MARGRLGLGVLVLILSLSVSAGTWGQLGDAADFVRLLNDAENSFLDEDYLEARDALKEAGKIIEARIEDTRASDAFFDLTTPENSVRSFLEASFLGNQEAARESWSARVPEYLVSLTVTAIQNEMEEDAEEKPEFLEPEMLRMMVQAFRYEKEPLGPDTYYVWATAPGKERSEDMQFRVVLEGTDWKVLGFRTWEKEDWFRSMIGEEPLEPISQWASEATASSEYSSKSWSAMQATGEPNTAQCGDTATAWAPSSSASGAEWLEVFFSIPVYATQLRAHETYNAGSVYKVEFVDPEGTKHTVWQSEDTTSCPGWFGGEFEMTPYLVKSVILHTQIDGYEEIDAVELTGIPEPE